MKRAFAITVDSDHTELQIHMQLQDLAIEVDKFYKFANLGEWTQPQEYVEVKDAWEA
jgi:hypothetical protein